MKKFLSFLLLLCLAFSLAACAETTNGGTGDNASDGTSTRQTDSGTQSASVPDPVPVNQQQPVFVTPTATATPTVYLAGDSTVKTYADNQYIAGWGQYLSAFLGERVTVVNKSEGGRSSRSFINEGRLYDYTNDPYSHRKYTSYVSIESEIKAGDYLLIQFGHNDDETGGNKFDNYLDRRVPLGTADANGVFPTTVPQFKVSTLGLPKDYEDYLNTQASPESKIQSALNVIKAYGDYYYSFDCGGTYKGYLKLYIDFARSKGATPILCTPVARVKYNSAGEIIGGAGRHGENFAYVQAVRQLAEEEDCLLIDTFAATKTMLETVGKDYGNYLMALKPNGLTGEWPSGYDTAFTAYSGGDKSQVTGVEGTHYNKYGAYLTAAYVAESLLKLSQADDQTKYGESVTFGDAVLTMPTTFIYPSNLIPYDNVLRLNQLFTEVTVSNRK